MSKIISLVLSGFLDKALSILKEDDEYLSIKDANKIIREAVNRDIPEIFLWLHENSIHRFYLDFRDTSYSEMFLMSCDDGMRNFVKMLLVKENIILPARNEMIRMLLVHGMFDIARQFFSDEEICFFMCNNKFFEYCKTINYDHLMILIADKRPITEIKKKLQALFNKAVTNKDQKFVELLLSDKRVDPSDDDNWAIIYACQKEYEDIAKVLLSDERVDPYAKDGFALIRSIADRKFKILKLILSKVKPLSGAYVMAAFLKACKTDTPQLVKIFLESEQINISPNSLDPLIFAISGDCVDVVQTLLKDGRLDPTANNNEVIRFASKHINYVYKEIFIDMLKNAGCKL